MQGRLIIIGTSAGGVKALQELFGYLGEDFSTPMLIVQHLPKDANTEMDLVYGSTLPRRLTAVSVEDKTPIVEGNVYFAPGGYHVLVERGAFLSLSQDEPVHFSRPSIDVAFESAARAMGKGVIGVLMTGANEDGAQGLHEIFRRGGITLVQDPTLAEVSTMPAAALRLFKPWRVGSVKDIGKALGELVLGATV